jgi:hypothetical protein
MPDIVISVTANQAQRIAAAFGPPSGGLTPEEWVVKQTKAFYKDRVMVAESRVASNAAHDAAVAQALADFGGF